MRIAIIGAGIGGLVTAAALQHDGHAVTILERRPQPGALGAGITLFGNSFAALTAAGLEAIVTPLIAKEPAPFRAGQRSPDGRWLLTLPSKATSLMRVIHRVDLHAALLDSLEPGTLHSGCEASIPADGSPIVTVANTADEGQGDPVAGSTATFDLVVAADGIQSRLRTVIGLDTGLRYSGYSAWRGVTETPVDVNAEAGETWGTGRRFGIAPLPDGRVYWFATDNLPVNTVFQNEKDELLQRFGDWHSPVRALIDATPAAAINRHDIYDLASPLTSFVRGRTVLLGDAAHAMTPDLGQGAGQAIEDAATLSLLLRDVRGASVADGDLDAALDKYDRVRRARSQSIAQRSRQMGEIAQWDSPSRVKLRSRIMRMTPSIFASAAALRVQRWKPPTNH